jgi:hypothetical protein
VARQVGVVRAGEPDGPFFELHGPSRAQPVLRDWVHHHWHQQRRGDHGGSVGQSHVDCANHDANFSNPSDLSLDEEAHQQR